MFKLRGTTLAAAAALLVLPSCAAQSQSQARDLDALDAVTSGIIKLPITTASADARNHFLQGQRELDLGHAFEANEHFKSAATADSTFALAHLNVANTGNSLAEFRASLERAERHAAGASSAERILIQMVRKAMDNDVNARLALAQQLVAEYPESPRAYLQLAAVQGTLNQNADARASMLKAVSLAPRLLVAHTDLGNSYLLAEPKDFTASLEHMRHAEALAPNEQYMHDLLGDVYRAQNDLPHSRAAYTRAHELNPTDASPLQQRGHVNSFAGDYAAARADYDSAIALGRANQKASFAPYRAFVNVYAGDANGAIAELKRLVAGVDTLNAPNARGVTIGALSNIAMIAIHTGDFAAADASLQQRTPLLRAQSAASGSAAWQRNQEASVAYFDSWLAARKGDYAIAGRLADRMATLVTPEGNPRRLEGVHELRGFIALYQAQFQEASNHFAQGNLDDPYIKYQYAVALEGAGDKATAKRLFGELAVYNFNNVGYALVRKDAQHKAS